MERIKKETGKRWLMPKKGQMPLAGQTVQVIGRIKHGGHYLGSAYWVPVKVLGVFTVKRWYATEGMRIKPDWWAEIN